MRLHSVYYSQTLRIAIRSLIYKTVAMCVSHNTYSINQSLKIFVEAICYFIEVYIGNTSKSQRAYAKTTI